MKRRDQPGTYFPVPKSVFLVELAPSEIAIYAYLMSRENRETYECIVGYEEIANATGMSTKSVPRHIKKLLLRGLIEVERTKVLMKDGRIRNGKIPKIGKGGTRRFHARGKNPSPQQSRDDLFYQFRHRADFLSRRARYH